MYSRLVIRMCVCTLALLCLPQAVEAASLSEARRDLFHQRYEQAETKLVDIARSGRVRDKQEALFLLASIKRSVSKARVLYEQISRIEPGSEWSARADLELAKIEYATGNYGDAFNILDQSSACRRFDEACYFQGLCAIRLQQYARARDALSGIHRGRFQTWAILSLAEIEVATNAPDEACRRYRSMARATISPTAMYRYAECLEKRGDSDGASKMFAEIIEGFRSTPEAILAAEKLERMQRAAEPRGEPQPRPALTSGFTIQFGAFHDRTNAIKLAAELKRKLPGVRIDSDLVRYREVHRVRYGAFATREKAQAAANSIAGRVNESMTIMKLP